MGKGCSARIGRRSWKGRGGRGEGRERPSIYCSCTVTTRWARCTARSPTRFHAWGRWVTRGSGAERRKAHRARVNPTYDAAPGTMRFRAFCQAVERVRCRRLRYPLWRLLTTAISPYACATGKWLAPCLSTRVRDPPHVSLPRSRRESQGEGQPHKGMYAVGALKDSRCATCWGDRQLPASCGIDHLCGDQSGRPPVASASMWRRSPRGFPSP